MKKDIKIFIKSLEKLKNLIEKNKICFDTFNYKLYGLSYDLYKNSNNILIKNLDNEVFYLYCDDMHNMFIEDFKNNFNSLNIDCIGTTSSRYINNKMFSYYQNELDFKYYNENDLSLLLDKYNTNIIDSIHLLIKDIKNNKIYTLLKYCIENDVYIPNLLSDIDNVKSEIIEIIKAFHYIEEYKNNVDNINNFIEWIYFNNSFFIDKNNLKMLNKKYVPFTLIDNILENTNFKVKKSGKYYKIDNIIVKVSDNIF